MEKLGIPQTHLSLKEMIQQVDNDHDGKISFREVRKEKSFDLFD
jgi:Ca2+-binding EF-hand superfamily protein